MQSVDRGLEEVFKTDAEISKKKQVGQRKLVKYEINCDRRLYNELDGVLMKPPEARLWAWLWKTLQTRKANGINLN